VFVPVLLFHSFWLNTQTLGAYYVSFLYRKLVIYLCDDLISISGNEKSRASLSYVFTCKMK